MQLVTLLLAVKVILPESGNLQHLAFWVAKGAGLFAREGVDVTLSIPSSPGGVYALTLREDAEAAVLPAPVYLDLIAERAPIRLVANLLKNEPANLAVRRKLIEERKLSPAAPLTQRLLGLRGMKIGVAPGPVGRLRTLFQSQGLDAGAIVEIVGVPGPEQNEALAQGRVDALFAHTPYLEKAILSQDAVLFVHTSAGEPAELASRQIHALCVRTAWARAHEREVAALVRAIAAAEALIHRDRQAAVDAILKEFPNRDRAQVERIVAIYEPAVPATPAVTVDGIQGALALFPSSRTAPDLSGVDLGAYIDDSFSQRNWKTPVLVAASAILLGAAAISVRIRRGRRPQR